MNVSFLETSNGGSTWTAHSDQAMTEFYARATVRTQEPSEGSDSYYLTCVWIALRVGPDASTQVETAVQVLNAPEAVGS